MVSDLSRPAPAEWAMARIAALLSPYYDKDIPQGVRRIDAEDWADALEEFPQWAIDRAAKWWKSADNPDRRKRPLEGDIVDRIREELAPVSAMRFRLEKRLSLCAPKNEPRERCTPAAAAEIMAKANFAVKRFPQ